MGRRGFSKMSGIQRMRGRNYWRKEKYQYPLDADMDGNDIVFQIKLALILILLGGIIFGIFKIIDHFHIASLPYSKYKYKTVEEVKRLPRDDRFIIISSFLKDNQIVSYPFRVEAFYYCMSATGNNIDNPDAVLGDVMKLCRSEYVKNGGVLNKRYISLSVGGRTYLGYD